VENAILCRELQILVSSFSVLEAICRRLMTTTQLSFVSSVLTNISAPVASGNATKTQDPNLCRIVCPKFGADFYPLYLHPPPGVDEVSEE
jgi:hypothetical protein